MRRNAWQLERIAGFILTFKNDTNFTAVNAMWLLRFPMQIAHEGLMHFDEGGERQNLHINVPISLF